jgi:hypothetical protein
MSLTPRQIVYAALVGIGVIATWTWNLRWIEEAGGTFDVARFTADAYANAAASSIANDISVAVAAFLVWSFAEARRLAMRNWWVYPLLTFGVAFAAAFPLFLFMRERKLAAPAAGA